MSNSQCISYTFKNEISLLIREIPSFSSSTSSSSSSSSFFLFLLPLPPLNSYFIKEGNKSIYFLKLISVWEGEVEMFFYLRGKLSKHHSMWFH
jgi:hypothetical protein